MRIAFLVNALADERPVYTTPRLARAAALRGHEVSYLDLTDLGLETDGSVSALARRPPGPGADPEEFLAGLNRAPLEPLAVGDLDVLMLRSEPSFELTTRPWAQPVGWLFGELARQRGVLVLSDPRGLALAGPDKYYTLRFPARHRPATILTRSLAAVRAFAAGRPEGIVLKPLHGGAGDHVFWVRPGDPNLAQIVAAVAERGYLLAQAYLPAIAEGCVRLFLLDGRPLTVDGQVAALRLTPAGEDIRTNYAVTGTVAPAELDHRHLAAAAAAGPRLAADGLFLVGLDLVGETILEANLHSPGGLRGAELLTGADFSAVVVAAVERKRLASASRVSSRLAAEG